MPSAVSAYSVRIISPGDGAMESILAREVMGRWNGAHALAQKRILLPVGEGDLPPESQADLLVAILSLCPGNSEASVRVVTTEIETYLATGKPISIYLSEARAEIAGSNVLREKEWGELRQRYADRARIETYTDEKEFRAKFARQLEAGWGDEAEPTNRPEGLLVVETILKPAPSAPPTLSICAETLLSEACEDFEGYIGRVKIGDTLKIQANGKQLVEQGKPDLAAKWEEAFQELLSGGFIVDAGCHGQLFRISPQGFAYLKTIGKMPAGYFSELGGM